MHNKKSQLLWVLLSAISGLIITLVLFLLIALIIKVTDLSVAFESIIVSAIKALSVIMAVYVLSRRQADGLLIKALSCGIIYALLAFALFVMLGGNIIAASAVTDVCICAIASVMGSIIFSSKKRREGHK